VINAGVPRGQALSGSRAIAEYMCAIAARASAGKSRQREREAANHNTTGHAETPDGQPAPKTPSFGLR
jgi:hypothetical protein